uniref:Uncharacterized protein LOC111129192 n=1 Tax=Crassostrea virginica TaxID=6565 RepID=A0A8B8DUE6_CRAVI|nr:uncharacterized protein LOC111129192 [Crassostrea virginica]
MFNETFKASSIFMKLSFIPAFLGFVNHLISFASSYWRVIEKNFQELSAPQIYPNSERTYCGLWNCFSCSPNCESIVFPLEDAIEVTRVFVTIGLFLSCGTLSLTLLCLFIREVASHDFVHIGAIIISISTGGCVLIGIVVYGFSVRDHDFSMFETHILHWSYYFCIAAFFMYFVNGILLFLNVLRIKTS